MQNESRVMQSLMRDSTRRADDVEVMAVGFFFNALLCQNSGSHMKNDKIQEKKEQCAFQKL